MSITIEALGLQEAQDYFEHASAVLVENVSTKLSEVCQQIAAYAQSIAPVRTGAYRDSIHVEQTGPLTFRIAASVPYAGYIEYGTAPHIIPLVLGKVLHWEEGGEDAFAMWVLHPGTAPQLIIHQAKKQGMADIVQAIRDGVREALAEGASK